MERHEKKSLMTGCVVPKLIICRTISQGTIWW
jgi:hypothetical protein